MPSFDDDIVDVSFYRFADLFLQACLNHMLLCGACVLEPEGHGVEAEWPIWGDECCCSLIALLHFDLMVSGICIKETQRVVSCGSVDDLINAGEGEGILRASLVEVFEIDAQAPGFILLSHHHQVCSPVRVFYLSDESGLD